MKRIKILFSFSLLLLASVAFGQKEKTISAMSAGTTLTVSGNTYKAGDVLDAKQSKSVQKAIKAFQKTYKAPAESRGAGLCYYWYYYCDGWGYCCWYKYLYYC